MTEEINPSLSAKPAVTFSERNAKQENNDVAQGTPIVAFRLITRHKAKKVSTEDTERSMRRCTTLLKTLMTLLIHSPEIWVTCVRIHFMSMD